MGKPRALVCQGPRCSKSGKKRRKLLEALAEVAKIEEVGCQKICRGPVAGVKLDGTLEWFAPLTTKRARTGLVKLLTKGKLTKALSKRHLSKRSGQRR